MKKILISILAIATLASCSKNRNEDALVPIRLGAGVDVATKAPVSGNATVQIEGWENTAADYTVASTWQSNASVSVAAAAAITLSPVRYYNANQNTTTYIKGWFPEIASETGTVTIPNTDGTVDVLLSNAVSGNKKTPVATDMKFDHQTAQLIFKVIKGEGLVAGTQIKSITVTGASVPTSIVLATDVVTYTSATALSVPALTVADIGATATQAGEPLMVEPVADNATLKLDIETLQADGTTAAATYEGVAFTTDDGKIEKGKAYTITLTFGQAGISIKASITDWVAAAGSGSVL